MWNGINTYFERAKKMVSSRLLRYPGISTHGLCCLSATEHELSLVYFKKEHEKLMLLCCETESLPSIKKIPSILKNWTERYQLMQVPTTWVLQPEQYQLISMEALPVHPDEFQSAIRWKVKELISFPVEDAVIDYFPLPDISGTVNAAPAAIDVVIARKKELQTIANLIHTSALDLTTITIPELTLHNLTAFFEEEERSVALVCSGKKSSQLIITKQKTLYFSRNLELGMEKMADFYQNQTSQTNSIDKFALELQRSFDYYQGQWRSPRPSHLFWLADHHLLLDGMQHLSKQLNMTVEELSIEKIITDSLVKDIENPAKFFPLVGAAFTDRVGNDATTH